MDSGRTAVGGSISDIKEKDDGLDDNPGDSGSPPPAGVHKIGAERDPTPMYSLQKSNIRQNSRSLRAISSEIKIIVAASCYCERTETCVVILRFFA